MSQQHLAESPRKTKRQIACRESGPACASFHGERHPLHQLQHIIGNRRVGQLIEAKRLTPQGKILGIQWNLIVGAANAQYRREADHVARQVLSVPDIVAATSIQRVVSAEGDEARKLQTKPLAASIAPLVQRQAANEEEDASIQPKSAGSWDDSLEVGIDVERQVSQSKGRGSPLPDSVRVHTGNSLRTASPANNVLQRVPSPVTGGAKDARVSTLPDLIQSHIATDVDSSVSDVSWRWVWRSEWNIYDASDDVKDTDSSLKYPDYTLKPATVKKGTPSDGKGNPWTARFEVTETGYPFGGDDPDNFPWGESHFHVYASPIADAKFDKKEETGNQVLAIAKMDVGEGQTGEYTITASGSETRTDSSSVTVTNTAKVSGEREESLSVKPLEFPGVEGGLKNKVGFEASRSIARMTSETLSQTQTLTQVMSVKNLPPGTHTFYLRPLFLVLSGSADLLSHNKGVVAGRAAETGSVRIWKGYYLEKK